MSPWIPRQVSRRVTPAVAVNTALATAVLAATVSADAPPGAGSSAGPDSLSSSSQPRQREPSPDREARDGAGGPGRLPEPTAGPLAPERSAPGGDPGTSPDSLTPAPSGGGEPEQQEQAPDGTPPPGKDPDAALAEALVQLTAGTDVRLSVSVLSLRDGRSATYGDARFDTASIVKVDILAALLLQAQDTGRELSGQERALAEAMIERSDNSATDVLWQSIGYDAGLDAANERLGLSGTTAGPRGSWGLTQTTSEDQVTLLRAVFDGGGSPLTGGSRAYIAELMTGVVAGQRWGVSAAAGGEFALKNGWLPRSRSGLWDVNSIGRVTGKDGRDYLMAVVSDGHATHAAGITVVEAAAQAAVAALRTGQAP